MTLHLVNEPVENRLAAATVRSEVSAKDAAERGITAFRGPAGLNVSRRIGGQRRVNGQDRRAVSEKEVLVNAGESVRPEPGDVPAIVILPKGATAGQPVMETAAPKGGL